MNYKDINNITLIVCGTMGIAVLALLSRYFFLSQGFDDFGANTVFFIGLVIGILFFISYIELLQHIVGKPIEKKDVSEETINQVIEEEEQTLDSIREQYQLDQYQQYTLALDNAIKYTQETFAPYTSNENIKVICSALSDYLYDIDLKSSKVISIKELTNIDLYHYGWNSWNYFKPIKKNKQEDIVHFLKIVFNKQLSDIDSTTIRKKLTFDEGACKIELKKDIIL